MSEKVEQLQFRLRKLEAEQKELREHREMELARIRKSGWSQKAIDEFEQKHVMLTKTGSEAISRVKAELVAAEKEAAKATAEFEAGLVAKGRKALETRKEEARLAWMRTGGDPAAFEGVWAEEVARRQGEAVRGVIERANDIDRRSYGL